MNEPPRPFPLAIALAGVIAPGLGLVLSALNIRWGAHPLTPDALQLSWPYVNVAMVWTWLLVWPALRWHPEPRGPLAWDFLALASAAVPAFTIAAFLTGITTPMAWQAIALQLTVGLLTMGAMTWQRRAGPALIAAILASLAVALPVMGYLWAEFFPAASQSWRTFIPVVAAARIANGNLGHAYPWLIGLFALIGFALWGTAPREK